MKKMRSNIPGLISNLQKTFIAKTAHEEQVINDVVEELTLLSQEIKKLQEETVELRKGNAWMKDNVNRLKDTIEDLKEAKVDSNPTDSDSEVEDNDPEEYGEYMFNEGLTSEQKAEIDKNTKRLLKDI